MTVQELNFTHLRRAYAAGTVTPVAVAKECLRRIAAYPDRAVWIARVAEEKVLERARWLAEHKDNADSIPLYGIPFAVKDNIDCAGLPTTAGCPAFAYSSEKDATVVARLLEAGAILLGKTNLDQFATGLVGTRSPHGAPRSVFSAEHISGGSSSGSAVAVAAGLVSFALGTDTAGSGRVPAAFNNLVGLKPTRGVLSTSGVVPACRTLDCVSIFALTVGDATEVRHVAEGFDAADPYSRRSLPSAAPTERCRFGVLAKTDREFFGNSAYAALYETAIAKLAALGGVAIEIDFAPFRDAGALLYDGPWVAERYAAVKDFIDHNEAAMDPTVARIIGGARKFSAADAYGAQYRLHALKHQADNQWSVQRLDMMLLPTTTTHYKVNEVEADPVETNKRLGLYTNFVNLLDYCAIAVPAGFTSKGLPFGVSFVGPTHGDAALAVIADRLHRSANVGLGANRKASMTDMPAPKFAAVSDVRIFVIGAHLSGMPLNHELTSLGGKLVTEARTAPGYRLFVLPNSTPPKPGLLRAPQVQGPGVLGEIWSMSAASYGTFVSKIPSPLGVGKVTLEDSSAVSGFLCEAYALEGAQEITQLGGWRNYLASR